MKTNPTPEKARRTRLGFLISGSASHVLAVHEAVQAGRLKNCEIAIVVCNIPGAPGAETARAAGIQTVTMEGRGREQHDHEDAIDTLFRKMRVDVVCLAGYLRVLSSGFVRRWPGKILNVHSSLLPAFPRLHAPAAALEFGARVTGCTVFFLDQSVDGGTVIEQRAVRIEDADTPASLQERIVAEEQIAYVESLEKVLSGQYAVEGRRYVRASAG